MDKFNFKIDYINGIVPLTRVDSFFESLKNIDYRFDLSNFVDSCFAVRGVRNYNTRLHFMGENDFIVCWNGLNADEPFIAKSPTESKFNPYIYITISGKGIDYLGSSFDRFFDYLFRVGFKCTRLDVACDIFNRDNVIVPYILQSFHFTSNMRKPEGVPFVSSNMSLEPHINKKTGRCVRPIQYISNIDINGNISENLVFGDHGSYLGMFRVYDKFLERGLDKNQPDETDSLYPVFNRLYPDRYWYRIEVELHKLHSEALFNVWRENKLAIYDVFASALISMFSIKISKSNGYSAWHCDVSPVWNDFLNELSNNIHFLELGEKSSVPVLELPIEELKLRLKHYAPLLCAYEDLCTLQSDFRDSIIVAERFRYETKIQYRYLRQVLFKELRKRDNLIAV